MTCECQFCSRGSFSKPEALPLWAYGHDGIELATLIGVSSDTRICRHCLNCKLDTARKAITKKDI